MVRVRWLDQMARSEMAANNSAEARALIKQAAEEMGEGVTHRHEHHGIVLHGNLSEAELDARLTRRLRTARRSLARRRLAGKRWRQRRKWSAAGAEGSSGRRATAWRASSRMKARCGASFIAKHLMFFAAGRAHQERCMMAANRVGKTVVGGYETTLHLTGRYPHWWEGRRFAGPIEAWVAGDTAETTRDIVQAALMGPPAELGTGLIPADAIVGEPSRRSGATGAFDTAHIRHASGGVSLLGFKSYDQGRRKFQGTAKHVVWLDEEPPADVYDECMLRLMTTDGLMLCTFTPLDGLTEIVQRFMPQLAGTASERRPG